MANLDMYLTGLNWGLVHGVPSIYYTDHHIKGNGWRLFSTYRNGIATKKLLFNNLDARGITVNRTGWDWHHIVQRNHLEPLYLPYDCDRKYQDEWPTVLMDRRLEHHMLNTYLDIEQTRAELSTTGTRPLKGSERRNYIEALGRYYQAAYTGDYVLQKVAQQVISSIF